MPVRHAIAAMAGVLALAAEAWAGGPSRRVVSMPSSRYCDPSVLLDLDEEELPAVGSGDQSKLIPLMPRLLCTPDGRLLSRKPTPEEKKRTPAIAKAAAAAQAAAMPMADKPVPPPIVETALAEPPPPLLATEIEGSPPEPPAEAAPVPVAVKRAKARTPSKKVREAPIASASAVVTHAPPRQLASIATSIRRWIPILGSRPATPKTQPPGGQSADWPSHLRPQLAAVGPFSFLSRTGEPIVPVSPIPAKPKRLPRAEIPPEEIRTAGPVAPSPRTDFRPMPRPPSLIPPIDTPGQISVFLSGGKFFPESIRLRSGETSRLLFTNANSSTGALVIESAGVGRWIAGRPPPAETEIRETLREIPRERLTEVPFTPTPGRYSFRDLMSGARGEILVE